MCQAASLSRILVRFLLWLAFALASGCDDAPYYVKEERERELARMRPPPVPSPTPCISSPPVSIAGALVGHSHVQMPDVGSVDLEILPALFYSIDKAFSLCSTREVPWLDSPTNFGANSNLLARQLLLCGRRQDGGLIVRAERLVLSNFVYQGFDQSAVKIYARHLTLLGSNIVESRGPLKFHVSDTVTGPGRLIIKLATSRCRKIKEPNLSNAAIH